MAELADARDLKSLAGNSVRVRSPLAALSQKGTRERLFLRSFLLFMSAKLSAKNAWNGRQRDQNIPRFKGNLLVFFAWICALKKSITFVFFYFCPWLYFVIRTWRRKSCLRRCVCFLYQGAHRYWRWSNNWNVPARSAPLSWKHCFLEASWHKSD